MAVNSYMLLCSEVYDGLVRGIAYEDEVGDVLTRELSLPKLQNERVRLGNRDRQYMMAYPDPFILS